MAFKFARNVMLLQLTMMPAYSAFALHNGNIVRTLCLRRSLYARPPLCMSARDEELERLRKENELLRRKIANQDAPTSISESLSNTISSGIKNMGNAVTKILNPVTSIFKKPQQDDVWKVKPEILKRKSAEDEVNVMVDRIFRDAPLPVQLFGGLMKGFTGLATRAMKSVAGDIKQIQEATERALSRDAVAVSMLGSDMISDSPFSQSFSSSSINGITTKRISLQMPISGSKGAGTVAVDAFIDSKGTINLSRCSLQVGGRVMSIPTGASAGERHDDIIDVEAR